MILIAPKAASKQGTRTLSLLTIKYTLSESRMGIRVRRTHKWLLPYHLIVIPPATIPLAVAYTSGMDLHVHW